MPHNAYAQDPYAQEFRIKISTNLAFVEARILRPPRFLKKQEPVYDIIHATSNVYQQLSTVANTLEAKEASNGQVVVNNLKDGHEQINNAISTALKESEL